MTVGWGQRSRALLLAVALLGCVSGEGGVTEPDPDPDAEPEPLQLEVVGRLERGSTVTLALRTQGVNEVVHWSAEPVAAVEFIGDDEVRLAEAGKVTFRAQAGERSGELEVEVAVPPTIVFELLRDGNRDIYKMALDGRDLTRLTTHPGDDRAPTAAAGMVVFVSYRSGIAELYSVPLDGGEEKPLPKSSGAKTAPALSQDGKRLAFTNSVSGVPKLWIAAGDGSEAKRAAPDFGFGGAIDVGPSWAPTGDRLVFVSSAAGTADLFIYHVSDARVDTLLIASTAEVEPAWSPDGNWVAFASEREKQTDLYMIHLVTREVRRLTDRAETDAGPAWLADGRLVYRAWVDDVPRLRWLDPMNPDEVHEIPVGSGVVGKVTAVW